MVVLEERGVDSSFDSRTESVDEEHEGEGASDAEDVVKEVLAERPVEIEVQVVAGAGAEDDGEGHEHEGHLQQPGREVAAEQDVEVA